MDYDMRVRTIGTWLQRLLKRYSPPNQMDDQSLRDEMNFMVTDINAHLPSKINQEQLAGILERIDGQVRANQGARTWPTIKLLVNATKDSCQAYFRNTMEDTSDDWSLDSLRIAEKRIKNNEPVSESYLRAGPSQDRLLEQTSVTIRDLEKYVAALPQQ